MSVDYKKALTEAQRELDELLVRQAQAEKRIAQLKITISGLQALCDAGDTIEDTRAALASLPPSQPIEEMGLTDLVREIMKAAKQPCTPKLVKEEMEHLGYDIKRYSNIIATLHIVMKRLVEQGEARTVQEWDGLKKYIGYVHVPTHSQERTKEAFRRGLKELSDLKGEERETKRKEVLSELAANRKASSKKK